jgi:hypothetical protein
MVWLLPLLLALLAGKRYASRVTVLAPVPALVAAVFVPVGSSVSLPWLLLGVELGLDDTGRVFLLFSSLLWLLASLYAAGSLASDHKATRFRIFFLLAMAGNLGLIVARDAVSFYLGFTLMGLAVYGLIAHPASQHARRAARRYLVWTIAGEMLLFVAVVMLAAQHSGVVSFSVLQSSPPGGFVMLLLLIGFPAPWRCRVRQLGTGTAGRRYYRHLLRRNCRAVATYTTLAAGLFQYQQDGCTDDWHGSRACLAGSCPCHHRCSGYLCGSPRPGEGSPVSRAGSR